MILILQDISHQEVCKNFKIKYKLYIMKKNYWVLHLYETKDKEGDIFKTMTFNTIKDISLVLNEKPQVISNFFHGLIKPRGVLEYCILYQSIPL